MKTLEKLKQKMEDTEYERNSAACADTYMILSKKASSARIAYLEALEVMTTNV